MPTVAFASMVLDTPSQTVAARRIDEVARVLEFAEGEARRGSFVALMISYEAAPAFDQALQTHAPHGFPLAWAATFPAGSQKSSDFETQRVAKFTPNSWQDKVSREAYDAAVFRIKELIAAGDTYQVNYSFPLFSSFNGDAYAWYRELCLAQGAPYCAYLDLGRYRVLSLSPELFFERRGNHVVTRPMKGTVRRGRWPAEDEAFKHWLQTSAKDRAENVMIVDLLRNDLGKVSVPGGVHVSSLFDIERFETVWQMTSTVESTLRDGTSLVELMGALFPCGSVTGAPKIRTMQIIRELEPFPRGVYTGTIGLLRPGGDCVFNVAIRTVVIDNESGVATFGVGGGVTIDSTPEREYDECLVKSRFLQSQPASFQLFESMLLEEGEFFLPAEHLERLRSSAIFFGFVFPEVNSVLEEISAKHPHGSWKIKVILWEDGRIETQTTPITPRTDTRRVALATEAVASSDGFLFHKTTRRDFYTAQLESRPDCDDLIFWNERGEITESSMANVVVQIGAEFFTPPVAAGLLAGTFRNHLLAEGKIRERVITIEELQHASEFFLINSVRKWMRVQLIQQDRRAGAAEFPQPPVP